MLSYVDIDYDNKNHEKIILTLSKRNKFYIPELTLKFNKNLPISFVQERLKSSNFLKNYPESIMSLVWCGKLIVLDNKVIGFSIQKENSKELCIVYLLIDKKYQNQTYGTTYVERLKSEINDKYLTVSRREDKRLINFYKKLGFKSTNEWEMTLYKDTEKEAIEIEKIINLLPLQFLYDHTRESIAHTMLSYFKF